MSDPEVSAARLVAFEVVRRTFEEGAYTDRAFRAAAGRRGLSGRDRAFAQRLAYGAVQRRGTSDFIVERLAERAVRLLDPPVMAALRLGLYELLFAESVPDHAAVAQSVELVKGTAARHASGLVNAVLRRAAREREELLGSFDDRDPAAAAVRHSVPSWLSKLWFEQLGADSARSLMAACNEPAEVALRANTLRARPAALTEELRAAGVDVGPAEGEGLLASPDLLVLHGPMGDATLERIASGHLTPQSRASAAVVEVLDPQPGERILDLCAGPGTKTGAIAARIEDRGEVVAVDIDRRRREEVEESMARLGVTCVRTIEADGASADVGEGYDRVLVDAPCSGLGTLASRPDARWRRSEAAIGELAELQAGLLRRAAAAVRPGGTLVYATCTICRRENEEQVAALAEAPAPREVPSLDVGHLGAAFPEIASRTDPRCLQTRPDRDRTTGFFISRLRRDD